MIYKFIITAILAVLFSTTSIARDYIHIVGSTTLFPFVSVVSEEFARSYRVRTPIVESIGTGGGFKLFCSGVGNSTPDIVSASRKITWGEELLCKENGVDKDDILELKLGSDGIVIANSRKSKLVNFSKRDLFLALSLYVPENDISLVKNKYKTWKAISPLIDRNNIEIYGPLKNTGTHESMINMIFIDICPSNKVFKKEYLDHQKLSQVCSMVRDDGIFIEVGNDENIIINKMEKNENAFGVFGYGFYIRNHEKVQANLINGISPTYENIASGKYALSRPLYLYIKKSHIATNPELKIFLKEVVSNNSIGNYGYLTTIGLIAPAKIELETTRDLINKL